MKREFGKKLIEEFFPRVDLTHVIDTSLADIPGHGTPTVILYVRNHRPVTHRLRTVMSIKREDKHPDDPARGLVWSSILDQVDRPGSRSDFVSVADSPREVFHKHPWSIGGGGAAELKELIDEAGVRTLATIANEIGFACITKADDFFSQPSRVFRLAQLEASNIRPFVTGDQVRDWSLNSCDSVVFPYDSSIETVPLELIPRIARYAWAFRTELGNRMVFGGHNYFAAGKPWYEFGQIPVARAKVPCSIVFACVATHNHFALDHGGGIFNRHAPVIKLPLDASEDDHLALLGLLNSSTACFWMKQVFFDRGGGGIGGGIAAEGWERFYEHDGTKLKQYPLPTDRPLKSARLLNELTSLRANFRPADVVKLGPVTRVALEMARVGEATTRALMIALQEELDWLCYRLYGLIEEDLTQRRKVAKEHRSLSDAAIPVVPPLLFGQRAFEIVMARKMAAGKLETTWFERHGSTPITELPAHWPDDYRRLVKRRIELIESDPNISLIEQPEYKRRWNTEPWESQLKQALRGWLLDRLEAYSDFDGRMNEEGRSTARLPIALVSVGKLADIGRQDAEFLQVGELYRDDSAYDVTKLVTELVEAESVPLLPVLRYKPAGLRKRAEWEKTWTLQRQEDVIEVRTKLPKDDPRHLSELDAKELKKKQVGTIPVPPKYTSADFLKGDYWRLRGKLDVPKERWVCFPHCEGEDGTLMLAWAGYDHLQLARAISAYYVDVQERLGGREDPRLVPLLACLIELLPWLKQWHNEVDPEFGVPMGDYFEGFLQEESRNLGLTLDEIKAWQPAQRTAGRGRRRAKG